MTSEAKLIKLATERFRLDIHGKHGISHWMRVRDVGLMLAKQNKGDPEVVTHFAFLHDACREDEWDDPEHGQRAADWCQALWSAGRIDLTITKLELLKYACRLHTDGKTIADITVQTCWDADRLDIGRVGVTPAARFLCTQAAKNRLANMQAKAYGLNTVSNRAIQSNKNSRTKKRLTISAILLLPMLARANQEWFFADGYESAPVGMEAVWLIGMYAAVAFALLAIHTLVGKSVLLPQKRSVRALWSLGYACCAGACVAFPVASGFVTVAVVTMLIVLLGLSRK